MLKRIISTKDHPVSKRTRSNNPVLAKPLDNFKEWISATEFENFCKKDKIIDWFNVLNKQYSISVKRDIPTPLSILFQKGIEYEKYIISKIEERTGFILNKHSSLSTSREYSASFKNQQYETLDSELVLESMKRGDNIIYSAYLQDKTEKIRGIPDLLVRNDYLSTLFPNIEPIQEFTSTSIFGNYYYVPVEIKFSSIHLDKNNSFILHHDRTKFYKTQLFTYCKILTNIQGYFPRYAFIIGKRTVSSSGTYNPLDKPGFIDYLSHDQPIIRNFYEGLSWLRSVKKYGSGWSISPYFYPNMKSDEFIFQKDKKDISEEFGEITQIWQCNTYHRENAIAQGITSWKDPRCTAEILGVFNEYRPIVNRILRVNRGELGDYYPLTFTKNTNDFKNYGNSEMFIDFETVRNSLELDSYDYSDEFIFLIGVWYKS